MTPPRVAWGQAAPRGSVMTPGPEVAWARFDDLVGGRALMCPPPHRILSADHVDGVRAVLAEVEAATAAGAWAYGFVSYEAAPAFDSALSTAARSADDPPLIWFGLCGEPREAAPIQAPVASGASSSSTDVPSPVGTSAVEVSAAAFGGGGGDFLRKRHQWRPGWTAAEHAQAVAKARDFIAAGDIYQVNVTDRLRAATTENPLSLYGGLSRAQRSAHSAYLHLDRFSIASASPELFFEWAGDRIRTRPMKGTFPRGRTPDEDAAHARWLRASVKDQAENLMIVDLLRNDLGRIAACGSVRVAELFRLERYPTVWQLTSEIGAHVRTEIGLLEIFEALFPCGSVTGAPKARSMRIIRELESGPRGVYCGAIGLVAPPNASFRARFSVAIRTAVVDRVAGTAVYGAGGGITWDSDPAAEHAELLSKAAVLAFAGGES